MSGAHAFRAYDAEVVVDQFARKINALCVWGRTLLAGLADGSLLFFEEQQRQVDRAAGAGTGAAAQADAAWQVTRLEKGFCKKAILQLLVVLEAKADEAKGWAPALISLTGAV